MSIRDRLRLCAAVLAVALACCGRHGGEPTGPQATAVALPPAAEPQRATRPAVPPLGRTVDVGASPEGVVVDEATRTVAVATRNPNQLVFLDAGSGAITGRIPLPGSARHLALTAPGGQVLVPVETANALTRVDLRDRTESRPTVTGTSPHDATAAANGRVFVSNEHGGTVTVLRGNHIDKVFTDCVQPAGLAASGTAVGMIDARKNTLTVYDAGKLTVSGSTAAGTGPTHLIADRHGRMIAADTRGNAIRVFDPSPLPHEVANTPQAGGPYGLTYDVKRDWLWVASSGTNRVVGYDMTDPTPRRVKEIPTVQNPYSLAVDPETGRLFIAGVSGGQVQIVDT